MVEIDIAISYVNELITGHCPQADHLDPCSQVAHGIDCVGQIAITADKDACVVGAHKGEHINGDLNIEVRFFGAIGQLYQVFGNNTVAVASHPEQKPLLLFIGAINPGIEKSTQQS